MKKFKNKGKDVEVSAGLLLCCPLRAVAPTRGLPVGGSCCQGQLCPNLHLWDSKGCGVGGEGEEGGESGSASKDARLALEMWCGAGWAATAAVGGTGKGQVSFGRVTLSCAGLAPACQAPCSSYLWRGGLYGMLDCGLCQLALSQ